jgi:hypothetical protein
VQTVSAGDLSITVGGTPADRLVSIRPNGVTNAQVANGALSPAKITGTAATLGPNNFVGDQNVSGLVFVGNPGAVAVDGIGLVGVRGSTGVGGFGIVGGAPAGGIAGQFNGNVNVVGPLSVSAGNLAMADSSATAGNILKGGVPFLHNFGTNNTFIGKNAGNLTMTGLGGNTGSGAGALLSNTMGFDNTASGRAALLNNTTGNQNTASGAGALSNNTTGDSNTASGFQALFSNTTGGNSTASGNFALFSNTTGNANTASGVEALRTNTTGIGNTAIGARADVSVGNLTNATAIGAGAFVNASNKIRLGDTNVTVIEGQVPYTFTSDKNQKENFQPVEGEQVLRKIGGLTLTSWNYIGHDPKQFRHYGPVAQEFFGAFGHDAIGTIGTATTINSGDLDGILMVAVQALEKRTTELRQEKERLKEIVEAVNGENAELKAELGQEKDRLTETVKALTAENAELKAGLKAVQRVMGSYALTAKAE